MRVRTLVLLLLLALPTGCGVFQARSVSLEAAVVNDGNLVLTVEGAGDLPEAAPVSAELLLGQRILGRGRAVLRHGRYFLTLDVSQAPGNTPLVLEVSFDPTAAPASVRREVGAEGERMVGSQVEEEGGRLRVVERLRVVLPMSRRDAAIRQVQAGDFAAAIAGLEPVVEKFPEDREAAAWLALAHLQRNPGERKPGSRAHQLLAAAVGSGLSEPSASQARDWLDRLDREATRAALRREVEDARQAELARQEKRRTEIVPGRSLGGIDLGMEAREVFGQHAPDRFPAFAGGTETVRLGKLEVEVDLDGASLRVTRVATTSPKFRLPGDLGVGSPLMAFQERLPGGVASFGPVERGEDGVRRAHGRCEFPEGLALEVERTLDEIGLPIDEVVGLEIVPPVAVPPPPAAAPGTSASPLPNP